ncbi:MAG: tetraacyldisaccharide 4'-kinase [Ignavibacteria bacterium]|nr:tetraacyldisaccharide 4'-kinase [Ignavibacteria bacterium]
MKFLRLLLIPFSLLYWLVITFRNKFFDWNIFKHVKLKTPVVSIGNIKAGGTGKTPFAIFLSEYFLKKNLKAAIISRGYKKTGSEDYFIEGKESNPSLKNLGDEPYLIFRRLKNISDNFILASGKSKSALAKIAEEKYKPDVIIIDDGFQHRKLFRNIDIVLTEHKKNLFDDLLLPAGNLRETKSSLKRASLEIRNNKALLIETNDNISIRYKSGGYFDENENKVTLDNAVYTLCAIANPDSFYSLINRDKINILRKFEFTDHYSFNEEELRKLFIGTDKEKVIVTTEKDFVKLKEFKNLFSDYKIVYLKIDVEFKKGRNIFENKLKEVLKL